MKEKQLISKKQVPIISRIMKRCLRMAKGSKLDKLLSKCDECTSKYTCEQYMLHARCFFQIEVLKAKDQKNNAIVSNDPKLLLADLQMTLNKFEKTLDFHGEPKPKDLRDLIYMKMQLYKMKHSDVGNQFNTQVNVNTGSKTSLDIKDMMAELRKQDVALKNKDGVAVEEEVSDESTTVNNELIDVAETDEFGGTSTATQTGDDEE